MQNVESISNNLRNNNARINSILTNFDRLSNDLADVQIRSTIDNANKAMLDVQSITDKIQKGEGSLGMLVHDDRLYTNLSSASEELDALIRDLKTNPGKYLKLSIFGKKDTR